MKTKRPRKTATEKWAEWLAGGGVERARAGFQAIKQQPCSECGKPRQTLFGTLCPECQPPTPPVPDYWKRSGDASP